MTVSLDICMDIMWIRLHDCFVSVISPFLSIIANDIFALWLKTTKLKEEINDKITALNRTIGKINAKPKEHLLVNEERW